MLRFLPLAASLLASVTLFGAVAVPSASAQVSPTYLMVLASPTDGRFIAGDTQWRCGAEGCVGGSSKSRPAIVCAQAARKLGKVASFTVKGEAIATDDLESCNKRAK
jgi:hypothetical protein